MVTFILCSAIALGAPASNTDSAKVSDAEVKPAKRLAVEIDRDISAALKKEATAKSLKERGKAVEQLCTLHHEITSLTAASCAGRLTTKAAAPQIRQCRNEAINNAP